LNANKDIKQRVLLIDDEVRIVQFIALKLKVSGYEVICADNGEKGLELARTASPDIVLLDIIMPGMDGLEVLQKLRQFSSMPVIVISARERISERALALGANGFMSKPFDPDDLVDRIKTILQPGCKGANQPAR
jgi:two-component system KDP operon response regulator KdpE